MMRYLFNTALPAEDLYGGKKIDGFMKKKHEPIREVRPEDFPTWKESAKGLIVWIVVMIVFLSWLTTQTVILAYHWAGMAVVLALPIIAIIAAKRREP